MLRITSRSLRWVDATCREIAVLYICRITTQRVVMMSKNDEYLKDGRLADVLALIQVLALSPKTKRSNEGLETEMQGKPRSAPDWLAVGRDHREFFRVMTPDLDPEEEEERSPHVSLIARFTQAVIKTDGYSKGRRPALGPDTTAKLMEMATDLHDRQVDQQQSRISLVNTRWTMAIPIAVAICSAAASVYAAYLTSATKHAQVCYDARPVPTESPATTKRP